MGLFHFTREMGTKPDLVLYNCVIAAVASRAAEHGSWTMAFAVIRKLRELSVRPDAVTFNSANSAAQRCSEVSKAVRLLSVLPRQQMRPDAATCGTAVSACARSLRWDMGLQLLASSLCNADSHRVLLLALTKAGLWRQILQHLEESSRRQVDEA